MDRLTHNDPVLDADEDEEINHINFISEFKEQIFPIYEKAGVELGTALMLWSLNNINNNLLHIRRGLEDGKSF